MVIFKVGRGQHFTFLIRGGKTARAGPATAFTSLTEQDEMKAISYFLISGDCWKDRIVEELQRRVIAIQKRHGDIPRRIINQTIRQHQVYLLLELHLRIQMCCSTPRRPYFATT